MARELRTGRRALLAGLAAVPMPAVAQDGWPDRPLQLIVPFPAGGAVDLLARSLAESLADSLGRPIAVMNRDGASGAIGLTAVATARPDGYVLGFTPSAPLTVLPHLQRGLSYSLASFRPICQVAAGPLVLAAAQDSPIRSLADAIAAARAAPGCVAVGYGGIGTLLHLALADLEAQGGVEFLHVPFRGDPPNVLALQSREIALSVLNLGSAVSQRLRILAVFSPVRLPDQPDLPTAREQGIDVVQEPVLGLIVAAGAPAPAIARLEAACRAANADARVGATLRATAQRPAPDAGEAYAVLLERSKESSGATLRRLGIAAP